MVSHSQHPSKFIAALVWFPASFFQITVNDLPVGRDVDETLRLVQAFKFTDEHGEVCPAGWKPGKKTMKPDAAGVAAYLSSGH